jgi:hypothetical protein
MAGMHGLRNSAAAFCMLLLACSSGDSTDGAPAEDGGARKHEQPPHDAGSRCGPDEVMEGGKCVDPLRRYEPDEQVDVDNVVSYSGDAELDLPDPPKSGFRIIVPPKRLAAGEEVEDCRAWAYPELKNKNVYAARVYTSGALHHSNVFGVPISPEGPSPYPSCMAGQADVAAQVPNLLSGDILDVLFANSTQIEGGEAIIFPKGMAFKIKTDGREIATTIHWLNVSSRPVTSEVVYDFFTMPDSELEQEIVPFVSENEAFSIAAHTKGMVATTCDLLHDAKIVSIMPHAHKRTTAFDVELIADDGSAMPIFHDGAFDPGSDIAVFDDPISTAGFARIHHVCTVDNDLNRPIVWGIGDDEMCTLFGYLYPPNAQQLGFVTGDPNPDGSSPPCLTLDLGAMRK